MKDGACLCLLRVSFDGVLGPAPNDICREFEVPRLWNESLGYMLFSFVWSCVVAQNRLIDCRIFVFGQLNFVHVNRLFFEWPPTSSWHVTFVNNEALNIPKTRNDTRLCVHIRVCGHRGACSVVFANVGERYAGRSIPTGAPRRTWEGATWPQGSGKQMQNISENAMRVRLQSSERTFTAADV